MCDEDYIHPTSLVGTIKRLTEERDSERKTANEFLAQLYDLRKSYQAAQEELGKQDAEIIILKATISSLEKKLNDTLLAKGLLNE